MRNFWCEIDLDQLDKNIEIMRKTTDKRIMAVVKANAYGLGIEEFTSVIDDKVDCFGVSNVEEAARVKSDKDILILYPVLSDEDIDSLRDNYVLTVDNEELLEKLAATGKDYRVHIFVDTGMNRFGVKPSKLPEYIELIKSKYTNIEIEGIYTHLHHTTDEAYTKNQIELFKSAVMPYASSVKYIHMFSSNGFLKYGSQYDFDNMIRLGNLMYGYDALSYGYKRIFSYKAKAIRCYDVEKGEHIGYGCYFKAKDKVRVGILDVGYADDFFCFRRRKSSMIRDVLKTIYQHFKYYSGIFYKGTTVRIIGTPNLNFTLVNMDGIEDDAVFSIDMNPLTGDNTIPKKWRRGEEYVQL